MGLLARGEREALTTLMERHSTRIYRVAYSYLRERDDALDAVQETFVKVFQNAARWDAQAEVGPWLTRIAINHCIDVYRRGRRRMTTNEPLEDDDRDPRLAATDVAADRKVLGRELGERIERALRGLPETQRA